MYSAFIFTFCFNLVLFLFCKIVFKSVLRICNFSCQAESDLFLRTASFYFPLLCSIVSILSSSITLFCLCPSTWSNYRLLVVQFYFVFFSLFLSPLLPLSFSLPCFLSLSLSLASSLFLSPFLPLFLPLWLSPLHTLSLPYSLSLSLCLSPLLTLSLPCSLCLSPLLPLSVCLSPLLSLPYSLSLSLFLTHSHFLSPVLTLSFFPPYSLSLSLSRTHSHFLSPVLTLTFFLSQHRRGCRALESAYRSQVRDSLLYSLRSAGSILEDYRKVGLSGPTLGSVHNYKRKLSVEDELNQMILPLYV